MQRDTKAEWFFSLFCVSLHFTRYSYSLVQGSLKDTCCPFETCCFFHQNKGPPHATTIYRAMFRCIMHPDPCCSRDEGSPVRLTREPGKDLDLYELGGAGSSRVRYLWLQTTQRMLFDAFS